MKYRKFGKLDYQVSALGFGAMRLPIIGEDKSKIDEKLAIKMIRGAIDAGVNYVDTAWPYHQGQSEVVVGKALLDGYRQKVKLASKSPIWQIETEADFDRILNEQLKKLQTESIDFYLMHALDSGKWQTVKKLDLIKRAEEARKIGKIKHIGFSFHDDIKLFKEIVDAYDWDFCQIQLNLIDTDFQAGMEGLKYAWNKGLAVVIMEPLKGGKLAKVPETISKLWQETGMEPVEGALKWLWNMPQVATVLSGMSTMEQVEENLKSADESEINGLNKKQLEVITKIQNIYKDSKMIPCTNCKYCMPCPAGVNIPKIFDIYNGIDIFYSKDEAKKMYAKLPEKEKADNCVECGRCEKLCPQTIGIMEELRKIDKEMTN